MRLKEAFRPIIKAPSVTIIATLSLALGIGATAAIFSIFNQTVLRALPVTNPAELVNLSAPGPKSGSMSCGNAGGCDDVFSFPMFRDLEQKQTAFSGIAAHREFGANFAYRGQTLNGEGMLVSGSYFPVLGVQPAIGRLLGPGDDQAIGASPVVVLSHSFWRSRFDESRSVLDEKLVVNGQSLTIVGVAPAGFEGTTLGTKPRVFVPIAIRPLVQPNASPLDSRNNYWLYLFARLKPAVSLEQARTAINVPYRNILNEVEASLQSGMSSQTMAMFKNREVKVEEGRRGQSLIHTQARAPLLLLFCVSGFVLLIACANVANLLLARAASRTSEIAMRLAIGASPYQIARHLLGEALVLAMLGGLGSLLVARWTLDFIASLLPADVTAVLNFVVDVPVMVFAGILTMGTGLLFGMIPALSGARSDLLTALKGQAGQPSGARSAARFRSSLATVQVALAMALLVMAGLFTKSLFNVARVDLGMKPDNVFTFAVSPRLNGYKPEQSRALFERLEDELSALPGVSSVAGSAVALLNGDNRGADVSVQGFQRGPDTDAESRLNRIGPGYFETLGIPLISGREFTKGDSLGRSKVAIVNEQFAQKFNLGKDVVGKRMKIGAGGELDMEIVGLVKDAKYSEVKQVVPPQFFVPYRQVEGVGALTFYVRTSLEPESFLTAIPRLVARLDANLPVENLRTLPQQIRQNVFEDRTIGILSSSFAALATILAAIGLYGVLGYTVAQRTREFGVRMALGATSVRLRRMILRQVATMTVIGGSLGLAAAITLGWLAQSMFFEIESYDPFVLTVAAVLLSLVALGAGLIPAQRAAKVDPIEALRYE